MLALHVMIWMGCRNIHLVGCDFGGDKDYYDDRKLTDDQRRRNRALYRSQVDMLKELSKAGLKADVRFISCTPNSPVNDFLEYRSLEKALDYSHQRVPGTHGALLHSSDREWCMWKSDVVAPRGVMVGCAPMHQDLIPWWVSNYRKYNNYPVVFANFGISDKSVEVCKRYGHVVDMTDIPIDGWFRKPFAILRAPFKKIVWLDLDIEVQGNIMPLFGYSDAGKVGVGEDTYDPKAFRKHMPSEGKLYDSGNVSVEHGSSVITEWAQRILTAPRAYYFGDHEVLSLVLFDHLERLRPYPKSLHLMRMEKAGDPKKCLTYHWTGEVGKSYIRNLAKFAQSVEVQR